MKISEIKGVGEKTENLFNKAGIYTEADLIEYYPRNYDVFKAPVDIKKLECNRIFSIKGTIIENPKMIKVKKLQILSVLVKDFDNMALRLVWFNQPYLASKLKAGSVFIFRGKITSKGSMLQMEQPQIFTPLQYEEVENVMQPVYPLVKGLSSRIISKAVKQILENEEITKDYLPQNILKKYNFAARKDALKQIHFPKKMSEYEEARKRLVFDEFFFFILAMKQLKMAAESVKNKYVISPGNNAKKIMEKLPYELTNAQQKVWDEIVTDMKSDKVMLRLVQGDVGCGKTILAILALVAAADNGYQAALMAPTEVLAMQHYESITGLFADCGISMETVVLTGSMTARRKKEVYSKIESGEADIIIGTHALIQKSVKYNNLALVITDEQHRFGVNQRNMLTSKGEMPHTIVMSATPIPRTLAIVLYGDLDVSVIDEMPTDRIKIKNCVIGTDLRKKAYKFIDKELKKGHQAYIICPMVEESDAADGENVIDYCKKMTEILPDARIEYLHGRMKPSVKNDIMNRFYNKQIDVLVSTTVVEVGVNVPNATVMMIESAERFGLFALHQLRGRVGRGKEQSYCIFVNCSNEKNERLEILNKSNDGFFIANEDLRLRGPGDFFGIRQSGEIEFKLGDFLIDADIIKLASNVAMSYLNGSIECNEKEKTVLEKAIEAYTSDCEKKINI